MFKQLVGAFPRLQTGSSCFRSVRLASSASRVTVKPLHSRKTLLVDTYKELMEKNTVVLFAHHNNLVKQEDAFYRAQIKELGGQMTVVRNHLFQVYLRNSHQADPCAPTPKKKQLRDHPLLPLFKGPTAAITFPETEPAKIGKVLKLLEKASDKMFIVGAKIDGDVLDMPKLHQVKTLPSKPQLQGQLLGILHMLSGAGLVRTLEAGSHSLYLTLQSHHDNIDPKNQKPE